MTLLLGLFILCLGWLAPSHFPPWGTFQQEAAAAAGALLIACAALKPSEAKPVRWPVLAIVAVLLALVPLLQLWAGQIKFASDALLASLYLAGFGLALAAGATLVQTRREEFTLGLFVALLAAGVVSTGAAAGQALEIGSIPYVNDMPPGDRAYANLAQPNHLADLLALALVAVIWLRETHRIRGAVAVLAIGWLGLGLVLTQSRVGWVFVAGLVVSLCWMRWRQGRRLPLLAAGASFALFAAGVVAWASLRGPLLLTASQTLGERMQAGHRLLFWRALGDALSQSPWVGYGWTQVGVAAQVGSREHATGEAMLLNSHNTILDLLLWNGVLLGLVVVAILVLWFVRQYRRSRDTDRWLLLTAVSIIFVHALVEFPLEYMYFLLPTGFLMGALEGLDESTALRRGSNLAFGVSLAFMAAMLGWIGVEYSVVEESARQMRMVMAGIGIDKVPTVPPPDVRLLDAPREYHRLWLHPARVGMSAAELDWMRTVSWRYPTPPAQLRYALASALNGRPDEASDTFIRLCHMQRVERCQEGYDSWRQAQILYPQLRAIPFPERAAQMLVARH